MSKNIVKSCNFWVRVGLGYPVSLLFGFGVRALQSGQSGQSGQLPIQFSETIIVKWAKARVCRPNNFVQRWVLPTLSENSLASESDIKSFRVVW